MNYLQNRILHDQSFRIGLASESFYWFVHIYFSKYIFYETADFQREIDATLEDDSLEFLLLLAFRGSAKTTNVTTLFAIWLIVGRKKKRYPVLIGDTEPQANQYLHNVKIELEENELLIQDFGPFVPTNPADDWRKTTLLIPKYGARISCVSDGQSVRGLREQEKRPDAVIGDDLESVKTIQKKEQRDKSYRWWKQDVMGVGDKGTLFVLIGNLLHSDSLMMRIKKEILSGKMSGKVLEFWILTDGKPTWPGKFPDMAAIDKERLRIGDERTWRRECLGHIVPEDGQEVKEEWIRYYDDKLLEGANIISQCIGVDLAISKKETADYTTMVRATVVKLKDGAKKILIAPNPIEERFTFHETVEQAKALYQSVQPSPTFFVEDVAFQAAAIEEMTRELLPVEAVKVTTDKRARLRSVASHIQQGTVLFPEAGCEDLLSQLLGFGVEAHDDLVDAMVHAINAAVSSGMQEMKVVWM